MVVVVVVVVTTVRVLVGAKVNCAIDGRDWWLMDRVVDAVLGGETVFTVDVGASGFGADFADERRFIRPSFVDGRRARG